MIQAQMKLCPNKRQAAQLEQWLFHLTSVWNWAVRKIELNANDGIYLSKFEFHKLLNGHSERMDIPSQVLRAMAVQAHTAWGRCFKKLARKPRLKGMRNKLNSIPFTEPIKSPHGRYIGIVGIGKVRFHKMDIPAGKIKCGRIVKRPSGWYLCLFIDAEREPITRRASGQLGIDAGFKSLLVTSEGVAISHPRELEAAANRLAQAQRGNNTRLVARIQEDIANRKKDRNHKLSHLLVSENTFIAFSKDNIRGMAKQFGKSVASSAHYQLRQMLSYKSRAGGTEYVEVDSRNSTKGCSTCGGLFGPTGLAGLSVRAWTCTGCGTLHDRDVNAAINTLMVGAGYAHEVPHA